MYTSTLYTCTLYTGTLIYEYGTWHTTTGTLEHARIPAVVPDIEVVGTFGEPLDGLLVGAPVDRIDRRGALDLQIA